MINYSINYDKVVEGSDELATETVVISGKVASVVAGDDGLFILEDGYTMRIRYGTLSQRSNTQEGYFEQMGENAWVKLT